MRGKKMRPKVQDSKILHSGFFDLRQDLLENALGATHSYTYIFAANAVAVLAKTKEGLWILNKEYRHPTGKVLLGPPGGRLEQGEDPLKGAVRELFEETGYWSDEVSLIGACHPFPGACDQKIYYVYAQNCHLKGSQKLEPFEFVEVELKTDEELFHIIQNSSDIDGNLCTALWYKERMC
jgi:ADP-ribose pyrophosphatase